MTTRRTKFVTGERIFSEASKKIYIKNLSTKRKLTVNLRLKKVSTYLETSLSSKKKRKNKNNFHLKEKNKIF